MGRVGWGGVNGSGGVGALFSVDNIVSVVIFSERCLFLVIFSERHCRGFVVVIFCWSECYKQC